MGYRSVVGICIKRDSNEAPTIPVLLTVSKMSKVLPTYEYFEQTWNDEDYGWDDDKFLFYVEDVKWYESYPDVQAMEALFTFTSEMNEDEEGTTRDWYSGFFVRIGEETADIEEKSFGSDPWDLISVTRGLDFDSTILGKRKGV